MSLGALGEGNHLFHGDNLDVLRGFPDAAADLIYLDPPFNSNADTILRTPSGDCRPPRPDLPAGTMRPSLGAMRANALARGPANPHLAVDGADHGRGPDVNQLMTIFVSGPTSNSVVFGVLAGERFRGADLNGSTVDGTLHHDSTGVLLDLDVTVPHGVVAVQGVEAPPDGLRYHIRETLPLDYADRDYVRLGTPLGPINARFQVLRTVDPIAA